jgi:pyruvate formate lyase activating enzyme
VELDLTEGAKAVVLDIQRFSTEDGPGLRTTVFFMGCTLGCAWCQNPESILFKKQVQWVGTRCIGCRRCLAACANSGLQFNEEGLTIDRKKCVACTSCVSACPT